MTRLSIARTCALAAAMLLIAAAARPHEVAVEQIVRVDMVAQGDRLVVRMQIPASALSDARLPRLDDGALDQAAMSGVLPVVTADLVRNLDLQQDGTPLPAPSAASRVGADRRSIDAELTYRIDGAGGLSARLNAFRSEPLRPVRTTVRYLPPSAAEHTLSVVGPPARVTLDPGLLDAAQESLESALTAVLAFGDHLLMLVCLLAPARSVRETARLVAALVVAQALGLVVGALGSSALATALPASAMVASSIIVVVAVQNVVRARVGSVTAAAAAFGVLNGLAFGDLFASGRQFAGSHQLAAFAVFVAVVAIAEVWLAGVGAATRAWLGGEIADRVLTPAASVLIAHTAVHHVLDRGRDIAQGGSFAAEHAVVSLALGWAVVMLLVGAFAALRQGRLDDRPDAIGRSTSV